MAFGEAHDVRGNCHDNAVTESFLNQLKRAWARSRTDRASPKAKHDVFDCIEMFYSPK